MILNMGYHSDGSFFWVDFSNEGTAPIIIVPNSVDGSYIVII